LNSKVTETETLAGTTSPASRHISRDERLIFESSAPGKRGMELPPLDVPAVDPAAALGRDLVRDPIEGFPEVSEIEVTRLILGCIRSGHAR
jgi:glycine dehydrogenase subunit 2